MVEGGRATGVEYHREGTLHRVAAAREVLLAGGALNSPQVLMLSGIGDPALLAAYDRRHQLNTRPLYHGTNAIVKLFTRETPPAKILRHGVLRLSQALPPLKHLITRQLTG